ncbi:MAG: hypothetical protein ACFFAN_10100 [Promethearchaeota archaeon]
MKYEAIKKGLIITGIIIIGLSVIELVNIMLLWNVRLNLDGDKIFFSELIIPDLQIISLLFFIVSCICFFFIIGIIIINEALRKKLDNDLLARYIFVIGVLILMLSFIKLGYITLLSKTEINFSGETIKFQSLLYKQPFFVIAIWIFFTIVVCCNFILGLILAAAGLKWSLELSEKKP